MWKLIGGIFLLSGVAGLLYSWIQEQNRREKELSEIIIFLQKTVGVMECEKIRITDYFDKQNSRVLKEMASRLSTNTYADGQTVWKEVLKEEKYSLDNETFQIILQAGEGFFGRSREENIRFLKKSISDLEGKQKEIKDKDIQERKVWIPVGMLGAVMLVIILI